MCWAAVFPDAAYFTSPVTPSTTAIDRLAQRDQEVASPRARQVLRDFIRYERDGVQMHRIAAIAQAIKPANVARAQERLHNGHIAQHFAVRVETWIPSM